ncbi:hypothetical protein HMPREF9554_02880 [Treponema phagedenis F0421]|nr:hypothetical protein HMPREF9554_02880 [Treponema phagedenis F0421]
MQTEPNLRVLKLCKQLCFKTSILLEPRASVPVLSFGNGEQLTIGMLKYARRCYYCHD